MDIPTAPETNTPTELTPAQLSKQKHASWGATIVIGLILVMVVVGAFYAWGQRIAQNQPSPTSGTSY